MNDNYADLFKAIGDGVRFEIVKMLVGRELCVCDILEKIDKSQPVISHHLKILKSTGIVTDRRSGKWNYYRLNPPVLKQLKGFLADARKEAVLERICD